MLLSSGDGYFGELLELPQGCQGPFRSSRGKVGFLLRCRSGKGPHLMLRGEYPGFSRVAAANLGSLSIYDGDLRDPLVFPQESPVSCELRGTSRDSFPVESGPRSSSGVDPGASSFLSSAEMYLGVHLEFPQGCQASYHVEICKSTLLSSWKSSVRLPVELT